MEEHPFGEAEEFRVAAAAVAVDAIMPGRAVPVVEGGVESPQDPSWDPAPPRLERLVQDLLRELFADASAATVATMYPLAPSSRATSSAYSSTRQPSAADCR